ncbi:MAG: hypothetical protein ACLVLH_25415 [Eisenbergiella massiliensis]
MKRITIVVSGGQEDSLAKQLAKGANCWRRTGTLDAVCRWKSGPKESGMCICPQGGSVYGEKSLQVPGFMSPALGIR